MWHKHRKRKERWGFKIKQFDNACPSLLFSFRLFFSDFFLSLFLCSHFHSMTVLYPRHSVNYSFHFISILFFFFSFLLLFYSIFFLFFFMFQSIVWVLEKRRDCWVKKGFFLEPSTLFFALFIIRIAFSIKTITWACLSHFLLSEEEQKRNCNIKKQIIISFEIFSFCCDSFKYLTLNNNKNFRCFRAFDNL